MSTLYLIRHGQASFGAADYDVLSERGAEQSRALGRWWAEREVTIDAWYAGPRKRHADTAAHLFAGAHEAGVAHDAEAHVLADFDEYPAFELLEHWVPLLREDDPEIAATLTSGNPRAAERAMKLILEKWARGELDTGHLESFTEFTARVERGLATVMEREGRGKTVAVVTSGGPISAVMKLALDLADDRTLKVAWVIANASVTELRYRDDELTLVAFNATAHLEGTLLSFV